MQQLTPTPWSKAAPAASSAAASPASGPLARSAAIDNVKVFLTLLVIFHHAGQPYGPTGGQWPVSHAEKFALLGPFFHINASFFMGLFFLISGYYVKAAYDRKGPLIFLAGRFWRFGVPLLLFALGFMPLARHFVQGVSWPQCFAPFEWAHLWFLGHLLVYAVVYVAMRLLLDRRLAARASVGAFPGNRALLDYALCLAAVSAVVRIWFPIDRWVTLGVSMEVAHLPQYASLFAFGVIAGSRRLLERIPPATGRAWLLAALVLVALRYSYTVFGWGARLDGGWLEHLAWCLWEALICVGMCVGLLHLAGTVAGGSNAFTRFLARWAFLVYVIHLPLLVFIQMALEKTGLGPLTLTLISGAATVLVCLLAGALAEAATRARSPPRRALGPVLGRRLGLTRRAHGLMRARA